MLLHDPIIALTGSALLGHATLAVGLLWYCVSLGSRVFATGRVMWTGGMSALVAVGLFSGLGGFYALIDNGESNVKIQFLATFVLIPVLWAALSELSAERSSPRALCRLLLLYVLAELVIMLLQLAYFLVGVGLPPNDTYESMVPGSQFNGNNLAAIVVLLSIFYNEVSQGVRVMERVLFNVVVILILAIIFSRLAVLLYVLDRIRRLSLRRLGQTIAVAAVLVASVAVISRVELTGNDALDASLNKARSLANLVESGFGTDRSTSSRSEGYRNFFNQVSRLGLGSAEIFDYSTYTADAVFEDEAAYAAPPHSLVIEFAYWMGWVGLLSLGTFMLVAYARPSQGRLLRRAFLLLAALVASTIPSSAIPLPTLWIGLLLLAMLGEFVRQGRGWNGARSQSIGATA